ncbi:MAG TPA: DUF6785 family protein [Chthonomonadaceae bacterium]|nr:DUF6785 family protein [Chthonomonadaceae bacterium]
MAGFSAQRRTDAPGKPQSTQDAGERIGEARIPALTGRALLVGVVCVVLTCFVVCYAELVVAKIQIGFLQLPPVVVGMLVLLLGTQALLGRLSSRLRLRPHELFTIYIMMLMASMVSSRGLLQKLIPLLVVPNYNATPENGWAAKFFPYIPHWLVPFDPKGDPKQFVSRSFFEALKPGETLPWSAWVVPMCAWGLFVALMFFAFLCLAALLRRQWVDNEKLAFPLVQLPLEMVRGQSSGPGATPGGSFLQNRLTWLGFALPALVFGLKGLHQYYPSFPDVMTEISLNDFFPTMPYNQMGYFHIFLSFAAVGFFYLLPTDLLFSLWFFFLLTKVEEVGAGALGYEPEVMPMYGCKLFVGYQIIGCYVVLVGYMLYSARPHLKRVWEAATHWKRPPDAEERSELLPYRTAFWGLVASVLLAAGWLNLVGMSYGLALFEILVLLFVVALVMARSVSESGMLMTETSFRPIDLYRMVGDVRNLGPANITAMAFMDGLWLRDQRGLLLTGFLDAMKFADGVQVRRRSLLGVFAIALVVAIGVSGYLHISLPYKLGAVQMYSYVYQGNPVWAFNNANTVLNRSQPPLPFVGTLNFFIGALITVMIATLRTRLLWFPLHPLGYALSGCWTMMVFWFPCLIAWLCKVVILRYGGMKLYVRARPFFLGMVLGEFTMAVLFTLPALFNRFTPTPSFPWP